MKEADLLMHGISALLSLAATGQLPVTMSHFRHMEVEYHITPDEQFVAVRLKGSKDVIALHATTMTDAPYVFEKLPKMPLHAYEDEL